MKTLRVALLAGVAVLMAIPGPQDVAQADGKGRSLKAKLVGFEEPPSVSSTGSGEFRARISQDETSRGSPAPRARPIAGARVRAW